MPTTTVVATADRKPRCRMHDRRGDPCSNEVIDADANAIQICPAHALRAAQLLAEAGAITIKLATTRRRSA